MKVASLLLRIGLLSCTAWGFEPPSSTADISDPAADAGTVRAQVLGSLYGFRPQAARVLSAVLEELARDLEDTSGTSHGHLHLICSSLNGALGEMTTGKHVASALDRSVQVMDKHELVEMPAVGRQLENGAAVEEKADADSEQEQVTPTLPVIISSSGLLNAWVWLGITLAGLVVLVLIAGQFMTHSSDKTQLSASELRHLFLTDPQSGTAAAIFSTVMTSVIILSLVAMSCSSCHDLRVRYANVFYGMEWMFLVVFSSETLGSVIWSPSLHKTLTSPWTYCDILAVAPSYFDAIFAGRIDADMMKMLRMVRICRLLRLYKLLGKSKNLEIIIRGLQEAAPAYGVTVLMCSVATYVPSVLMFHVEGGEWDPQMHCYRRWVDGRVLDGCSPFQDIFQTMYWGVTTVTTVGYGDVYPVTGLGRVLAAATMFVGIIALAVPIGMISNAFTLAMQKVHQEAVEADCLDGSVPPTQGPAAEKYALMAVEGAA